MNKKEIYRITEEDINEMITETVNQIINEFGDTRRGQYMLGRAAARAVNKGDHNTAFDASKRKDGDHAYFDGFENQLNYENAKSYGSKVRHDMKLQTNYDKNRIFDRINNRN